MASMLRRGSRAAASRALALGRAESYHSVAAWRVGGPTALLRGVQPGEDGGFGGKGPVSDPVSYTHLTLPTIYSV